MQSPPLRIVLVGTTHPGNIGATARAMKTMALDDLCLVAPRTFPDEQATARASGADDVLDNARVYDTLDEALTGCGLVMGASARLRSLRWPVLTAREAATRAGEEFDKTRVAMVFGREKTGLTNDELARCHYLINIHTNPDFSSLNLAMAVQVLAYEVRVALTGASAPKPETDDCPPASHDQMRYLYEHLERVMLGSGFLNPNNPRHLLLRVKRLFNRARPDQNEVNILRGLLTAMEEHLGDPESRPRRQRH